MAVQQDQLDPVNTSITFESVNTVKADRLLHNGTDYVKSEFQTPRPSDAYYIGTDSVSGSLTQRDVYIDREFVSLSPVDAYYLQVDFPTVITTAEIKVYSTTFIANLPASGTVEILKAFTPEAFLTTSGITSSYTFRVDLTPQQYEYKFTFSTPQEAKFWKLRFKDNSSNTIKVTDATEVIIKDIPAPKLIYYQTNGNQSASFTPDEGDLLDFTYDVVNDDYYTIRFNDESVGSGLDPDDDFLTVSGTTQFNNIRWSESLLAPSFFRSISNDNLVFSTTSGDGLLSSNFTLSGNQDINLDFNITTLSGNTSFFGIHTVEATTDRLVYGVGVTAKTSNSYYKVAVLNFTNSTTSAQLLDLNVDLETAFSGSQGWTVKYNLGPNNWTVSGSVDGAQTPANTGAIYSNPYISFQISAVEQQINNDSFTFTVDYEAAARAISSGTLNINRASSSFTSGNSGAFNESINNEDLGFQIIGTTNQTINLTADNFTTSGDFYYPAVPVFTVDRVNDEGEIQQEMVESFNVIKDPTKTYNDYINGGVQLAIDSTQNLYVKILDSVYRFSVSSPIAGLVDENTVGVTVSLPGVIPENGVYSFNYSTSNGGFLYYTIFDENTEEVQVKTLSAGAVPTPQDRKLFLNVPDWEEHQDNELPYQVFHHAIDNDTLFYLRRHGTSLLNSQKVSSSTGVTNGTSIFTDSSVNYNLQNVKKGDLIIINKPSYAGNGTYKILSVNSNTSITVDDTLSTTTAIVYTIVSNAELMQFNTDPSISAFSALNVDDFTLRAGTGDTTEVTVEVISAWGDPLNGKNVNFAIVQGDGVVAPPSATTSGSGEAITFYTVGTVAGPVQIEATVSD